MIKKIVSCLSQVLDSDLLEPPDVKLNNEMMLVDRVAKREIRRLEAEVSKVY